MKKVHVAAVAVVIIVVTLVAYAGWRRSGPNQFEAAFNPGGTVTLDLSAGGYHVQGTNENRIRVEPYPGDRGEFRSRIDVNGANARVELEGPSNNFAVTIFVPQRSDLNVDQTIGDLVIRDVIGNKNVGLAIGKLQIELPNDTALPSFQGGVIIGDLRPSNWHIEKGGFFRSFNSSSPSPYSIVAHVDIGELSTFESGSHSQQADNAGDHVTQQDSAHDSH